MKKILVIALIISNSSFASELVYCPDSIECQTQGNLASCKMNGGSQEYWGKMANGGLVEQGVYQFVEARGVYGAPNKLYNTAECQYQYKTQRGINIIDVELPNYPNSNVNLEAHLDSSGWTYNGIVAECYSLAKTCPYDIMLGKSQ